MLRDGKMKHLKRPQKQQCKRKCASSLTDADSRKFGFYV